MNSTLYVLCYHGVFDTQNDARQNSSGKHIQKDIFYKHILRVKQKFPIISVEDVENKLNVESLEKDVVLLTFDDGYANLFSQATPILVDLDAPATLFLATKFIGTNEAIWTDLLEYIFLNVPGAQKLIRDLIPASTTSSDFFQVPDLLQSLRVHKELLKTMTEDNRARVLETLCANLDLPKNLCEDPLYAFLDWNQIVQMQDTGLWSFGSHTHSHVSLGTVSEDTGAAEIKTSHEIVEKYLPNQGKRFSFPEGQPADIPSWAHRILQSNHFLSAFSAYGGTNFFQNHERLNLKRVIMGFNGQSIFPWGERAP